MFNLIRNYLDISDNPREFGLVFVLSVPSVGIEGASISMHSLWLKHSSPMNGLCNNNCGIQGLDVAIFFLNPFITV